MNLLYFITGDNPTFHSQCYFSMLSFKHAADITGIYVYTDHPEFYNKSEAQVFHLTKEHIKNWRGEYDFFWRIKIKVIEHLINIQPEIPVVYLDTDTFLYKPFDTIAGEINQGKAFMHLNEGMLKDMKFTPYKMWKQIAGKSFGGLVIEESMCMWNAGLVAIPTTCNQQTIKLALDICDDMCAAKVKPRLIEQYSLSLALQTNHELKPADQSVAHYWANKDDWNNAINNIIKKAYMQNSNIEDLAEEICRFDFSSIAYKKDDNNTRKRMLNFVDKLFKESGFVYIK